MSRQLFVATLVNVIEVEVDLEYAKTWLSVWLPNLDTTSMSGAEVVESYVRNSPRFGSDFEDIYVTAISPLVL